jgi:hypothetical protein
MKIKTVKCSVVAPSEYDWMGAKHNWVFTPTHM